LSSSKQRSIGQRAALTRISSPNGSVSGALLRAYLSLPPGSFRTSSHRSLAGVRSALTYTRTRAKLATNGPLAPSASLRDRHHKSPGLVTNDSTVAPSVSSAGCPGASFNHTLRVQAISAR
jgi:hypothetical protein